MGMQIHLDNVDKRIGINATNGPLAWAVCSCVQSHSGTVIRAPPAVEAAPVSVEGAPLPQNATTVYFCMGGQVIFP